MLDLFESIITGMDDKEPESLSVTGTYKFFVEPIVQGALPNSSCTLIISAFEDSSKRRSLDFEIKWFKLMNGDTFEIKNYSELFYHVNPSDIGLKIKASVCSKSSSHPGIAYVYFGPVTLDYALKPEIEGMILSNHGTFKVNVLLDNGKKVPPNESIIIIEKPNFILSFDKDLIRSKAIEEAKGRLCVDIEVSKDLKLRSDNQNSSCLYVELMGPENSELCYKLKFESRIHKDIFYIFLKIMKILKQQIIDELKNQYDDIIRMKWCFVQKSVNDDDTDDLAVTHDEVMYYDCVRELLKSMIRINKELNEENGALLDSIEILEADLEYSVKEFRSLLADMKSNKATRANFKKYEDKSKSIIAESSMILEEVKNKGKKKTLDATKEDRMNALEKTLEESKKTNQDLIKELEEAKEKKKAETLAGSQELPVEAKKEEKIHLTDLISQYNETLKKTLIDLKSKNIDAVEFLRKFQASVENKTLLESLGDNSKEKMITLIEFFKQTNKDLQKDIEAKKASCNVELKIIQLKKELGEYDKDLESEFQSIISIGGDLKSTVENEARNVEEEEELAKLVEEIERKKEESAKVEKDLKNITMRNKMIEKEIKNTTEQLELLQKENLDEKIKNLEEEVSQIKDELKLLSS